MLGASGLPRTRSCEQGKGRRLGWNDRARTASHRATAATYCVNCAFSEKATRLLSVSCRDDDSIWDAGIWDAGIQFE